MLFRSEHRPVFALNTIVFGLCLVDLDLEQSFGIHFRPVEQLRDNRGYVAIKVIESTGLGEGDAGLETVVHKGLAVVGIPLDENLLLRIERMGEDLFPNLSDGSDVRIDAAGVIRDLRRAGAGPSAPRPTRPTRA